MQDLLTCDVCIVGAGSGGLVVAAAAAQMGADSVLIERNRMGGDCLNYGCVPSKALIAAAAHAQSVRSGTAFGIRADEPQIDFAAVMAHVHEVIAAIAPNDSVTRFEGLGVRVIAADARFVSPRELEAAGQRIRAKLFVLATGSHPVAPPIPGLDAVPYLTNETIFDLKQRPEHLLVIGGGPIGLEMAQAFRRLGSKVTVLEAASALGRDEPELADVVLQTLAAEGIELLQRVTIERFEPIDGGAAAVLADGGRRIVASHVLVAAGRRPTVAGLGLEQAGIAVGPRGITVDDRLRTSNPRVWAIGDCNGLYPFTHMAGYQAGLFVRGGLLRLPARLDRTAVPWVTFTDPELAQVGLSEQEARKHYGDAVSTEIWKLHDNDRAQAERRTEGMIKIVLGRRNRILGAAIVAPQAGELIQPWCLAISRRLPLTAMAGVVLPYPTLGEISKRVAGNRFSRLLFGPTLRRIVRLLLALR